MPEFYTRYGKRIAVQLEFHFPSLTEQHHKDACDVNFIMRQYQERGVLPEMRSGGTFGDFSASPVDFREACELVRTAREKFESLPSNVRERFNNDPGALLEFLDDPANRDEAVKLGLVATVTDAPDARAGASSVCVPGAAAPGAEAEASVEDSSK